MRDLCVYLCQILKGIVHSKKENLLKCTHSQAIQDVDELFVYQNRFGEI